MSENEKSEPNAENVGVTSTDLLAVDKTSTGNKVYHPSIKDWRKQLRSRLNANRRCYDSLSNKDCSYAKAIKTLGDLHQQALKVYDDAPDFI